MRPDAKETTDRVLLTIETPESAISEAVIVQEILMSKCKTRKEYPIHFVDTAKA